MIIDLRRYINYFKDKLSIFGPFSIRLLIGLILGIGSLILFAKLSEDILQNETVKFDTVVTNLVRIKMTENITQIAQIISDIGSQKYIIAIGLFSMAFYYFHKKHFWDAIQIPVVLAGSAVLNQVLKYAFHRQRPSIPHLQEATGLSFPSGHAMVNFAFYGLLMYLAWINITNKPLKYFTVIFFGLIILSIGISRIYLGVHYPSDVAAGFAAGAFWLVASSLGFRVLRYSK